MYTFKGDFMSLKFDILMINAKAKEDAANGNKVINGCVGTLRDDEHNLLTFTEVKKVLKDSACSYLDYAPVVGYKSFKEGVVKWLFNRSKEVLDSKLFSFGATMGGTGALATSFKITANEKAILIYGDIVWPNYVTIAEEAGVETERFELIKDDKFNFDGLKKTIDASLKKRNKVVVLINDPCENPIGYSFKNDETKELFNLLEEYNKDSNKVDLILDIAYVDYASSKLESLDYCYKKNNFNIYLTFSGSKSFGIYGIRCGALLAFAKNEENAKYIQGQIATYSRGTISSPNGQAIGPLSEVLNNPESKKNIEEEIRLYRDILISRGKCIIESLKKYGIGYLPYHDGFYITLKTKKNAYETCEKLFDRHIYLAPISDKHIRVAICSVSCEEISKIVEEISKIESE